MSHGTSVGETRRIAFGQWTLVLVAAWTYALTLSWFSIAAHQALLTQMNDLGNVDQALWAASRGDLMMTQSNDVDDVTKSRFAIHLNFIFVPLALLYRFGGGVEMLLVLGAFACAAAGTGLFAYARLRLGNSWWCLVPPLAFFASPIVHDANLFDFKILTIGTAALVWAIWAFESGRPRLGWALLAILLLGQEDLALLVLMVGISLVLRGRWREGVAIGIVALGWLVVMFTLVVPAVSDGGGLTQIAKGWYAWLVSGGAEGEGALLWTTLLQLLRPDHLRLPLYLLISGGLVALPAWRTLILLVPAVFGAMLDEAGWMTRVTGTYYHLPAIAVILLAVIDSAARRPAERRSAHLPLAFVATITPILSLLLSPLPHGLGAWWSNYPARSRERAALERIVSFIPADAPVSVQNNLGPWLSRRPQIGAFPRGSARARLLLFHPDCGAGPDSGLFVRPDPAKLNGMPLEQLGGVIEILIHSREWAPVAFGDGFFLFERRVNDAGAKPGAMQATVIAMSKASADCEESRRARWRIAPLLVGRYDWGEMPRLLGRGAGEAGE